MKHNRHDRFDSLCEDLARRSPRERLAAFREMELSGQFSESEIEEVRDYFLIAHERSDVPGLLGKEIGGYRLLEVIGSGGSGVVYLVESQTQAQFALKLLHPDAAPAAREFFRVEARQLAAINTPAVARLCDHGLYEPPGEPARPYLVTEIIYGLPIDRYAERYRLSAEERVALVAGVCEALAAVYLLQAIVHLDLKPSNILVNQVDGHARIIDLGISRRINVGMYTSFSLRALTPGFASPEQRDPDRFGLPGSRSDQYSLALVLRELLAREPDAGPGLRAVLARASSERPAARYPDLKAFAASLQQEASALAGHRRRQRWSRRALLAALAAGVLLAGERTTRPLRSEAQNLAGRRAQEKGKPVAAGVAFSEALALDPHNARASYNAGVAAEDRQDLAAAKLAYHTALENSEDPLPALNNLGLLLIRENRPAQALAYLEQGIERLGSVGAESSIDVHRRAYRLYKNLGWAELELSQEQGAIAPESLKRAEEFLRRALRSNGALLEHDALELVSGQAGDHDAAAYCLLARVLSRRAGASRTEIERCWRSCSNSFAHGELEQETWKREANAQLGTN